MADGSRQFASLPQTRSWYELRDHLAALPGLIVTALLTDDVTEAWIDFTYRDHSFSVNDQHGDYWFFVDDPRCPDDVLAAVADHCATLLRA
jgi:hypothetical protein